MKIRQDFNRIWTICWLLFILISCDNINKNNHNLGKKLQQLNREQVSTFQLIIDSADVKGSVLIFDPEKSLWLSNDFDWATLGRLPASTFKIVNSIIALETGVVEDDSTMFYWNGEKRRLSQWERDMSFSEAFHLSCVPCYQDVARRIGSERMMEYLTKFNYGNMQVDSSNIDVFWLQGD